MAATTSMAATTEVTLPDRSEVDPGDCWDLSDLYLSDDAWEADFAAADAAVPQLAAYKGRLSEGPEVVRAFLDLDVHTDRRLSRLHQYAQRSSDQDTSNGHYRGFTDRLAGLWTRAAESTAFFRSELMGLSAAQIGAYLASEALAPFRFTLEQVLRAKPYTLSEPEERLLAMSGEVTRAPSEIFGQLNDADMRFGFVTDENGNEVEVTHGSYSVFLSKPKRDMRRAFFETFYAAYRERRNTLATTLAGAVKRNIFYAKARGFQGARVAALFNIEVPAVVYDSLISAVHDQLPSLYRYYDLRRRLLNLPDMHFYDVAVPVVPGIEVRHGYEEACEVVLTSLEPLGEEYVSTLREGLFGGWVDRYENRGKRSGAYSSDCYDVHPYVLLNYKPDELNNVYTLTHEAGHAMHSWHSTRHQPPQYAGYRIFVAEVASTFNEILLTRHLLAKSNDAAMRAYIVNREIDNIRGTLFRQTMFAEFEHLLHRHAEERKALSIDEMTALYHGILERYYGPDFTLDPELDLEFLRIPHFYYNFYVFQYATGISAAYALTRRVIEGGDTELQDYLRFLSSGGSKYPIELLRDAGVDMTSHEPVAATLAHFDRRVDELEQLMAQ